jgi:NAD(P)-dependent dehydrogenase (short-subunit alcohol dehydrogenase family)
MALSWRVVWVTGASTGIGAEICKQLAAQGVKVAASARNADALAKLGTGITPFPLDVTNEKKVAETFSAIESSLGKIDLVIACAGTYTPASAADFRTEMFKQMYEVNYLGVINTLAAVIPVFRKRRAGHLSWIASVSGYRGLPKAAAYGPTKAALINLAESLQPELARDGVKVSVINPGFVRTPMTAVNDFEMPFLMEPADAAKATITGLAKGKFEVAYPTPFVVILKIGRLLPYWLFLWVSRKYLLK